MHKKNQNSDVEGNFPQNQDDAIILLKQTIAQLEGVINQLQTKDHNILPPLESCQDLLITAENLAQSLTVVTHPEIEEKISSEVENEIVEEIIPITPVFPVKNEEKEAFEDESEELISEDISLEITQEGLDNILPSFNKVLRWWDRVLLKIRAYLPSAINDKISDWGLTGIISSLIVTILLTSVILLPDNPKLSPPISSLPETQFETPIPELKNRENPPELNQDQAPIPVKNVELPPPKLTPEQKLITGIKNQVASLTNQYAEGLIFTIKADFIKSRLQLIVTDKWQDLTVSNQQKLSNKMWDKAEFLDFKKLELFNQNGDLLARSPVVGHEMIIIGY